MKKQEVDNTMSTSAEGELHGGPVGRFLEVPENRGEQAAKLQLLTRIIYFLSALLIGCIMALIAVSVIHAKSNNEPSSTSPCTTSGTSSQQEGEDFSNKAMHYYWTKQGLEMIPLSQWSYFSNGDQDHRPYIANIPFPKDDFTDEHLDAWNSVMSSASIDDLVEQGIIVISSDKQNMDHQVQEEFTAVPTLFSDPIVIEESPLDYRLQYAADIGSRDLVAKAMKGRLVNPAGRRLREHFYRFPDQCDATPIALEVFLRLMIYHQIEMFFTEKSIGLWHDLFPEVGRRPYNNFDVNLARWYGERYAESYVHKISNNWVYPLSKQNIDTYMIAVGLDPEDKTEDPTSPIGLGNLVGRRVTEWMHKNDGLSRETDFIDEVGLQLVDDHHSNKEWHQWQPSLAGSDRFQGIRFGIVTRQTFVSPSLGIFSFLYENESDFANLGLLDAVPKLNTSEAAYIERAKDFLEINRNLSDRQKAVAELSNNKISGSVFLILAYVPTLKRLATQEEYPALYDEFSMISSGCAEYAAVHAAWRHKRTYLAGRPKSVMRELSARNSAFREAYPEAENFEPLIPAGDHPEYPSGSSAIYSAFAQAADDWFEKRFNYTEASKKTGPLEFKIPAKKFYWSDGPSRDVTLEYANLYEWVQELPMSRVYGGVHWKESGEAGLALGEKVGHACMKLLDRLNDGDMTATYPSPNRERVEPFNVASN